MENSTERMSYEALPSVEMTSDSGEPSRSFKRVDTRRSDASSLNSIPDDLAQLRKRITKLEDRETELSLMIEDMQTFSTKRQEPFAAERRDIVREKEKLILELQKNLEPPNPYPPAPGSPIFGFVDNTWFTTVCNIVVSLNLVWMAFANRLTDNQSILVIMDQLFLMWYVLELYAKWQYHLTDLFFGSLSTVWWNWLDGGIVFFGVLDQWVFTLLKDIIPFKIPALSNFLRCLRLFRLLRVLRVLKVFVQGDLSWTEEAPFQLFMSAVIGINSVVMALELDYDLPVWFWFEELFLLIYTFELVVRMKSFGCKFFINQDRIWNNLDFIMVIGGIMNLWIMPLWGAIQTFLHGGSKVPDTGSLHRFLKLVRMMKILRVLRLVRLLKMVKPLYALLVGVLEALDAMKWVMVLTLLVLYAGAIVFTSLIGHGYIYSNVNDVPPEAQEFFGSVPHSIFALFKLMNGDTSVVEPITTSISGKLLFAAFMVLSNWAVLAILTSVVSDHMISTSNRLEEEERKMEYENNFLSRTRLLNQLFSEIDDDDDGKVTKSEWVAMLKNEDMAERFLDATNLDPRTLKECFKILAEESATGPTRKNMLEKHVEPSLNCQDFVNYLNHDRDPTDRRQILHQRYMIEKFVGARIKELETSIRRALGSARGDGSVSDMQSTRPQSSEVPGVDVFFEKEKQYLEALGRHTTQGAHSEFVKELEVRSRVYPRITAPGMPDPEQARLQEELARPENIIKTTGKHVFQHPPKTIKVPPHWDSQYMGSLSSKSSFQRVAARHLEL